MSEVKDTTYGYFFPKTNKPEKCITTKENGLASESFTVSELCQSSIAGKKGRMPRPKSKHTKISQSSLSMSQRRSVNCSNEEGSRSSVRASLGLWPGTSHRQAKDKLDTAMHSSFSTVTSQCSQIVGNKSNSSQLATCASSITTQVGGSRSELPSSVFLGSVPINTINVSRSSTGTSSRKVQPPCKMIRQRRATPYNLRQMTPQKPSRYNAKHCKAQWATLKEKRVNLDCNYSASSFLEPFLLVRAVPYNYVKRYPSRRSPYNKKLISSEDHNLFDTWPPLIVHQCFGTSARRVLENLPIAPPPKPRRLTDKEQKKLQEQEEDTLRELRIFLRDILSKLGREKKLGIFTKPVDIEEAPDYYDIIKRPMDLSTMMANIDLHKYNTASAFLDDIFLICSNALEYNPDRGPTDRAIRHRACALRDTAQALLKAELDPEFEQICREIAQSRKRRGVDSSQGVPAFYHTRPLGTTLQGSASATPSAAEAEVSSLSVVPEGCRYSRRVRGLEADRTLPLEAVEKTTQVEKSLLSKDQETPKTEERSANNEPCSQAACMNDEGPVESSKKINTVPGSPALDDSIAEECIDSAGQTDCKCTSSSTHGSNANALSGKARKGSADSKHMSIHAVKKASRLKKCPWLATKRRRRPHSTPAHRHEIPSHGLDTEEMSGEEFMDTEHSPSSNLSESWERIPNQREHSPLSAANPANVNDPSIIRNRSGNGNSSSIVPVLSQAAGSTAPNKKGSLDAPVSREGGSKPRSARSLDMDLVVAATDSGISSESNGDSRDSLDHNNSNRINAACKEGQGNAEENIPANTSTSGPSFARTRSRNQNPLQLSALAALETEIGTVVVDKERLVRLLDMTVDRTHCFTLEKLQHTYSMLSCAIFNHRYQFDKTNLVQEMETIVEKLCGEA